MLSVVSCWCLYLSIHWPYNCNSILDIILRSREMVNKPEEMDPGDPGEGSNQLASIGRNQNISKCLIKAD